MNPKDIKEWVDFLTGAFATWGKAAKNPITSADFILQERGKKKITTCAVEIWFAGFVLSLVAQLPIYKIIGIEWSDPAFFAPYTAVVFGMFLVTAATVDFSLKRIGVKSEFPRTFLIYSCVMAVVAPVTSLLTFHGMSDILSPLETAKHEGLGFFDAVIASFPAISAAVNENIVLPFSQSVIFIFLIAMFGLLQQALCKAYEATRWDISRAFGFAFGVLLPIPLFISVIFIYFVFFAFL